MIPDHTHAQHPELTGARLPQRLSPTIPRSTLQGSGIKLKRSTAGLPAVDCRFLLWGSGHLI